MPIKVRIGYENFLLQPDDLAHLLISMSQDNAIEVQIQVKALREPELAEPMPAVRLFTES